MSRFLIGIDLGTTGCRSVVSDELLNILGESYHEYELIHLSENEIEQDPEQWWSLVKLCVREAVKKSGVDAGRIAALSISSQGISFLPVDCNGSPLRNAFCWLDTRAQSQTKSILSHFPESKLFTETGKRVSAGYVLPKILWLMENEPGTYEKTHRFLMAGDYINMKLTGRYCTDRTMASGTLLYNINTNDWSDELLSAFDIDGRKLPELVLSGEIIGSIRPEIAAELEIPCSAAVVMGGQDQKCSAFGAGIDRHTITASLGTACGMLKKMDYPFADKNMAIPCFSYLFDRSWVLEAVISTVGASLKWLKGISFQGIGYDQINAEVEKLRNTNVMFFPHMAGAASPHWRAEARGCFLGLSLSTRPADLVLALFEGVAFQMRRNLEAMPQMEETEALRIFGGGAKSGVWCGIIADITHLPVNVLETTETAALGALMLAGKGLGICEDSLVNSKIRKTYTPSLEKQSYYDAVYDKYCRTEDKLLEAYAY